MDGCVNYIITKRIALKAAELAVACVIVGFAFSLIEGGMMMVAFRDRN